MLYQALTGRLPSSTSPGDILGAKLRGHRRAGGWSSRPLPMISRELCDSLLRIDPTERPDAGAVLEVIGGARRLASSGEMPVAAEAFVGRSRELAVLEQAFATVKAGGTVTTMVEGVSGVGKSALVRRFLRSLEGSALVFHGRCHEREYVPYNGIDAIVDGLATHLVEENDDWLGTLSARSLRLLPRLFPRAQARPPSSRR